MIWEHPSQRSLQKKDEEKNLDKLNLDLEVRLPGVLLPHYSSMFKESAT